MAAVPFTMDAGISKVSGVVRDADDELVIEYQSKILGLIPTDIKTIRIPYQEIDEVFFSSSIFKTRLRIILKTLRSIGNFPTPKQGELQLKIARKNRQQAKALASSVNLSVSKYYMLGDEDEEDDFV